MLALTRCRMEILQHPKGVILYSYTHLSVTVILIKCQIIDVNCECCEYITSVPANKLS